jgi:hypothetical protein
MRSRLFAAAVLAGCGGEVESACDNADGALTGAGFVFVTDPSTGKRVESGFEVTGCSSTFEASVNWRLRGRDGKVLERGVTQGGSLRPSAFRIQRRVLDRQSSDRPARGPTSRG